MLGDLPVEERLEGTAATLPWLTAPWRDATIAVCGVGRAKVKVNK